MYIVEHTWTRLPVLICIVTLITVGVQKAYPNRMTGLAEPTSYTQTLPKRALFIWTHENLANFCKRSTFKISHVVKKFNSKSDACLKRWYKIWHVVKFSTQNLTRCKKVDSNADQTKKNLIQNLTRRKKLNSKTCF